MKTFFVNRKKISSVLFFIISIAIVACSLENEKKNLLEEPAAPLKVVAEPGLDLSSIVISWKAPEDTGKLITGESATIQEYTIQIAKDVEFQDIIKTLKSKEVSVKVSDLTPNGTIYYVRVAASNGNEDFGISDYSLVTDVKLGVLSKAVVPGVPLKASIKDGALTGTKATIGWSSPVSPGKMIDGVSDAKIVGYEVQYSTLTTFTEGENTITINTTDASTQIGLSELKPLTTYYLRIASKNNSGDSNKNKSIYSDILEFTTIDLTQSAPEPPSKLEVKSTTITETSVTLAWNAPENTGKNEGGVKDAVLTGYELEYSPIEDFSSDNIAVSVKSSSTFSLELSGLLPATTYYARVLAINNNSVQIAKKSSYSSVVSFTTKRPIDAGDAQRPEIIQNLAVSEITDQSAFISWEASDNFGLLSNGQPAALKTYRIEYSTTPEFISSQTILIEQRSTFIRLVDLKVATRYYLRVTVINDNRISGLDVSLKTYINEGFSTDTPVAPDLPTLTASLDNSSPSSAIVLSWIIGSPGLEGDGSTISKINRYEIQYTSKSNFDDLTSVVSSTVTNPSSTSLRLTGLTPDVKYIFRMRVVNNNNDNGEGIYNTSSYSSIIALKTKSRATAPSVPSNLVASAPSSDADARTIVMLSWKAPTSSGTTSTGNTREITNYLIEYVQGTSFEIATEEVTSVSTLINTTNFRLSGLGSNKSYIFRVVAVNGNTGDEASKSSPSPVTVYKTKDLAQNPVMGTITLTVPSEGGLENRSATLSWIAPASLGKQPNGDLEELSYVGYGYRIYKSSVLEGDRPDFTFKPYKAGDEGDSVIFDNIDSGSSYIFEIYVETNNINKDFRKSEIVSKQVVTGAIQSQITIEPTEENLNPRNIQISRSPNDARKTVLFKVSFNDSKINQQTIPVEVYVSGATSPLGGSASLLMNNDRRSGIITYTTPSSIQKDMRELPAEIVIPSIQSYPMVSYPIVLTRPVPEAIRVFSDDTGDIVASNSRTYTAVVIPQNAFQEVDWSVNLNAGSITPNGVYTAINQSKEIQGVTVSAITVETPMVSSSSNPFKVVPLDVKITKVNASQDLNDVRIPLTKNSNAVPIEFNVEFNNGGVNSIDPTVPTGTGTVNYSSTSDEKGVLRYTPPSSFDENLRSLLTKITIPQPTGTSYPSKSIEITLTRPEPSNISITPSVISTITTQSSQQLNVVIFPENAWQEVIWSVNGGSGRITPNTIRGGTSSEYFSGNNSATDVLLTVTSTDRRNTSNIASSSLPRFDVIDKVTTFSAQGGSSRNVKLASTSRSSPPTVQLEISYNGSGPSSAPVPEISGSSSTSGLGSLGNQRDELGFLTAVTTNNSTSYTFSYTLPTMLPPDFLGATVSIRVPFTDGYPEQVLDINISRPAISNFVISPQNPGTFSIDTPYDFTVQISPENAWQKVNWSTNNKGSISPTSLGSKTASFISSNSLTGVVVTATSSASEASSISTTEFIVEQKMVTFTSNNGLNSKTITLRDNPTLGGVGIPLKIEYNGIGSSTTPTVEIFNSKSTSVFPVGTLTDAGALSTPNRLSDKDYRVTYTSPTGLPEKATGAEITLKVKSGNGFPEQLFKVIIKRPDITGLIVDKTSTNQPTTHRYGINEEVEYTVSVSPENANQGFSAKLDVIEENIKNGELEITRQSLKYKTPTSFSLGVSKTKNEAVLKVVPITYDTSGKLIEIIGQSYTETFILDYNRVTFNNGNVIVVDNKDNVRTVVTGGRLNSIPQFTPTDEKDIHLGWHKTLAEATTGNANTRIDFNTETIDTDRTYFEEWKDLKASIANKLMTQADGYPDPAVLQNQGSRTNLGFPIASSSTITRTFKEVANNYIRSANRLNDEEIDYILKNIGLDSRKYSFRLGIGDRRSGGLESRYTVVDNWSGGNTEDASGNPNFLMLTPAVYTAQPYNHQILFNSDVTNSSTQLLEGLIQVTDSHVSVDSQYGGIRSFEIRINP